MSATKSHLDIYIYKILALLADGKDQRNGMSGDALKSMNNLIDAFDSRVISNINRLMVKSGKKTVSANEIRFAIRLTVRGSLAAEAISAGDAAVTQYRATIETRTKAKSKASGKLPPMSRSKMAAIDFPVTRIENIMMERITSERKSGTAAVFFAAASEYVATRILTLASTKAEESKKVRITTRHLKVAYSEDAELAALFKNVIMSGGVVPADAADVPAPTPKKAKRTKKAAPTKAKAPTKPVKKAAKAAPAKPAPKKAGKPKAKGKAAKSAAKGKGKKGK